MIFSIKYCVVFYYYLTVLQCIYLNNNNYYNNLTQKSCPEKCHCQNNFITCYTIPKPNVISLDLSNQGIDIFPGNYSSILNDEIKILNLSHNQIEKLHQWHFENVSTVEILDISMNQFRNWLDIDRDTFFTLISLYILDLSHNRLGNSPYSIYSNSLLVLKLMNCSLTVINDGFLHFLPNLQQLYLNNNPLTIITTHLYSNSLQLLDLSQCDLRFMHYEAIYRLSALKQLILRDNRNLKKFASISKTLETLDLSNCNLDHIPNSNNFTTVKWLNLHGNHLRHIPSYGLRNFQSIQYLDLSYNSLYGIDEEAFHPITNLTVLDLSFNTLAQLQPNLFQYLTVLNTLNLSHNYLHSIETFGNLSTVEIIDLSSCELQHINRITFTNLTNLRVLNLSHNFLSLLPYEFSVVNLQLLDVSVCHLTYLANRTFGQMQKLRSLNLYGNRLTELHPIRILKQLQILDLRDNPWRCDCDELKDLYMWLNQQLNITKTMLEQLRCQSPEFVEGLNWLTVCMDDWHPELHYKSTLWWYSLSAMTTLIILLVIVVSVSKIHQIKLKRFYNNTQNQQNNQLRRRTNRLHDDFTFDTDDNDEHSVRHLNNTFRESQTVLSETGNAPDPRDLHQRPPSYCEALLLPKLPSSGSHISLTTPITVSMGKNLNNDDDTNQIQHNSNVDLSKKGNNSCRVVRRKKRKRKPDDHHHTVVASMVNDSISQRSSTTSHNNNYYISHSDNNPDSSDDTTNNVTHHHPNQVVALESDF